jgi:hypothetical protein
MLRTLLLCATVSGTTAAADPGVDRANAILTKVSDYAFDLLERLETKGRFHVALQNFESAATESLARAARRTAIPPRTRRRS